MTPLRADYLSWGRVHRYAHHVFSPGFIDSARATIETVVANRESALPLTTAEAPLGSMPPGSIPESRFPIPGDRQAS